MKKGCLIPNGVILKPHEQRTVNFLIDRGHIIELVPPKPEIRYMKTPDTIIDGKFWEIKSPKNDGKYTIDHLLEYAEQQSANVIVDLRRAKAPIRSLSKIRYHAKKRKKLQNIIVITKQGVLLEIKGTLC